MQTSSNPVPGAAQGPERSGRRDLVHLVLLTMPWALLGWLWWRVAQSTAVEQLLTAVGMVLLLVGLALPLNLVWILHNVRIFRRKGPRRGLAIADLDYRTDWTRRPVVADWAVVRAAAVVVVHPTDERKVFQHHGTSEGPRHTGALPASVGGVEPRGRDDDLVASAAEDVGA
jgi:hypothetical protein